MTLSTNTAWQAGYKDTPAANTAESTASFTCDFAGWASFVAAVCWLWPLIIGTGITELNLVQLVLYVGCIAAWTAASRVCFSEDFLSHAELLALPVCYLPRRPTAMAPICPWLAAILSFLTWSYCFSEKLPGWGGVEVVFFINVFIAVMIWAARSVAYRAVPRDEENAAVRAARRANKITTCCLGISAELWLNPIMVTEAGSPFLYVPLFLLVAFVFGYACSHSMHAKDHKVQYGLHPNANSTLMVSEGEPERLDSFGIAIHWAYIGYVLSAVVLVACIYFEAPQLTFVQSMFSYELIVLAAIIGARLMAARSIRAQWKGNEEFSQQDQNE